METNQRTDKAEEINEIIVRFFLSENSKEIDECFKKIYNYYNRAIFSKVKYYLGYHKAQDVTNDVFLKLYDNRKKIKKKNHHSLKSWLITVAFRTCIDIIRSTKSAKSIKEEDFIENHHQNSSFDEITLLWSYSVIDFFKSCVKALKIFTKSPKQEKVLFHEISHLHIESKSRYSGSGLDYETYRTNLYHAKKKVLNNWQEIYNCVEPKTWK